MTSKSRQHLERLLKPRHIAVIGGRDAEVAAGECARIGYEGPLWPVNPKRDTLAGHRCFKSVDDLPEPPDAVFLAIPRDATIDVVARLSELGAGGVICYSAGFGETGEEGARWERALVDAAGDVALVGPNCYGVINYVDRIALWPFAHGGAFPGFGAAIITQSGMLSSDLTMSQRSVPFAYMISVGNQAVVQFDTLIEVLCEKPEVRAIGLHIEGLSDIPRFAEAALKSIRAGVPIVALKSGSSRIGARLTISHTGSLSGTDDLYQALFERLGIIRVDSPAQLLETLKFLCVCGTPNGVRIAGFTCSGGGATALADHAEKVGLDFPQPVVAAKTLSERLPYTATVSNPLDYTTPIWGDFESVTPVLEAMFLDRYDAAVIVQDYPLPGLDESKDLYLSDARSFIAATSAAKIPAAVCSTLPENIDLETREMLIANGVAPMQGIHEALEAIRGACAHARRRDAILKTPPRIGRSRASLEPEARVLDEWDGKMRLWRAGIPTPSGVLASAHEAPKRAAELGFPVALKMVSANLPHKSEAGAVMLNLADGEAVLSAAGQMRESVALYNPNAVADRFLVERMVARPIVELLVNVRDDPTFGPVMTIALGGTLVELLRDAVTILLPAERNDLSAAIGQLKSAQLMTGFRGGPPIDPNLIADALTNIANLVVTDAGDIVEVEINPLMIYADHVCAVDVLMRTASNGCCEFEDDRDLNKLVASD